MKNMYLKQTDHGPLVKVIETISKYSLRNNSGTNMYCSLRNISCTGVRPLFIFLLILCFATGKAGSLINTPQYSQLTIIVANPATGLLDKTIVGFNPNSTDSFNTFYDANKLEGLSTKQTLYTMNSGEWMSINILPNEATVDTVAMGLEPGVNATFTFSFSGLNTFDSTCYIYLEDKKMNLWYNIRNGDYTFKSLTTDNWNRFVLHFTPPAKVNGTNTTCAATSIVSIQQPGIATWTYRLTDTANTIISSGIINQIKQATLNLPPGTYSLLLTDTGGYSVHKTITVNAPQSVAAIHFVLSDTSVLVMQPVALTDTITPIDSVATGTIVYQWSFGNNTYGTGTDTTISFAQPGIYNIALTATNQSGCSATQMQKIVVNDTITTDTTIIPKKTSGITGAVTKTAPSIWSNSNRIYVDFTAIQTVDAIVTVYNILGQELSEEHYTGNTLYQNEVYNITAAYLIVKVVNNHEAFVKKVLVSNK